MNEHKRRPIRLMLLRTVLSAVTASLIVTSMFGVLSMINIQSKSEKALTEQATANLSSVIDKKTAIADLKFRRYKDMVTSLTHFIEEIYGSYDSYQPRDIQFADPANGGKLVMQPVLANDDIKWEDVRREAGILANAADHFEAVMTVNTGIISSIFFGAEDGFILSYDDRSDQKPLDIHTFNYFDSEWYKLVNEKKEICFTDVTEDPFSRGLVITCAGPVYDGNGKFRGVLGIDLLINDLYSELMDMDLGEAASFFVSGSNGKIISLDPEKNDRSTEQAGINLVSSDRERMGSYNKGVIVREGRCYAFDTIETVKWRLCVSVPQSHVQELATTISQSIISSIMIFVFFFLIILLSAVIMVYESSKKITRPLTELTKDIEQISGGNLDHRVQVQGSTETAELAESFNKLADSLKNYISDVTSMTAEKERITAELDIATKIQSDMMPVDFPDRDDISLYASMTPAKEVGGDFYDFFFIDSDHLALVMADVSGKGVPAALFMVISQSVIRNCAVMYRSAGDILTEANRRLCKNNKAGFFVTAWIGILDLRTGEIRYSNAGHEYPSIRQPGGEYELFVTENMPPLAAMDDTVFTQGTFTLEKGGRLFLYTDGVPEAKSGDGKRFGTDRMTEVLNADRDRGSKDILDDMQDKINEFTGGADPFDDITMMSVVWNGK